MCVTNTLGFATRLTLCYRRGFSFGSPTVSLVISTPGVLLTVVQRYKGLGDLQWTNPSSGKTWCVCSWNSMKEVGPFEGA